jgi:hypothetical protein
VKIAGIMGCALLAALAAPFAVQARDQLGHEDAVTVDQRKSYIFYRTTGMADVQFVREATAEDRAAYRIAREQAYVRARRDYERRLPQIRRHEAVCRQSESLQCRNWQRPPEITPETFEYPPIELGNMIQVTRGPQFTREEPKYSYLIAVDPGTYVLYGQIVATENGMVGTCLCMGSVKFEARAGRIVDLGAIRFGAPGGGSRGASARRFATLEVAPPEPSMPLPARLAGLPVAPAELRAAGKLPNFYGVEIDRHPALPGVLGYERDRVIDLREQSGGAPGAH